MAEEKIGAFEKTEIKIIQNETQKGRKQFQRVVGHHVAS